MVNNYQSKTGKQSWDEDKMKNATIKVFNNEMGLNSL